MTTRDTTPGRPADDAPTIQKTPRAPRSRRARRRGTVVPWPMPSPTGAGPAAQLHDGPHDGLWLTLRPGRAWARYRHGRPDAQSLAPEHAAMLARHSRADIGAYLLARLTPDGRPDPYLRVPNARDVYVHTSTAAAHGLIGHAVALALAGSHLGRALTGRARHHPDDVLDALLDHVDDLVRLRLARDRDRRANLTQHDHIRGDAP